MSESMPSPAITWGSAARCAACFAVPTLGLVAWARGAPDSFHAASLEDGPIETLSAAAFFASAVGFAVAAGDAHAPRRSRVFLALAALATFFFCGEELSWGQRILGFETPDALREVNQQGEFNVHNVGRLQPLKYSMLVATVGLVGVALPWLRLVAPARRLLAWSGIPVVPFVYSGVFLAALFALRHAANWLGLAERNDPQEAGELLFAAGLALFGLHAAWRTSDVLVAPAAPAAAAAAAPSADC
jgi:hypothetical protein